MSAFLPLPRHAAPAPAPAPAQARAAVLPRTAPLSSWATRVELVTHGVHRVCVGRAGGGYLGAAGGWSHVPRVRAHAAAKHYARAGAASDMGLASLPTLHAASVGLPHAAERRYKGSSALVARYAEPLLGAAQHAAVPMALPPTSAATPGWRRGGDGLTPRRAQPTASAVLATIQAAYLPAADSVQQQQQQQQQREEVGGAVDAATEQAPSATAPPPPPPPALALPGTPSPSPRPVPDTSAQREWHAPSDNLLIEPDPPLRPGSASLAPP
eukprot:COSAG01_NODE_2452_length_7674_cov_22.423102_4_plen_269_part_01